MIGKLKGIIDEIQDDYVILDVHGVGYVVFATPRLLSNLPAIGEAVVLFIETQMREDAIKLFGFMTKIEREWFRLLQNVQGVGAKVALALLTTLTPKQLADAIALRDSATICRAQGVGKRVAERIISELKDKILSSFGENHQNTLSPIKLPIEQDNTNTVILDAISALCNLGYAREQAANAISLAVRAMGEDANSAQLIRLGLKELSR